MMWAMNIVAMGVDGIHNIQPEVFWCKLRYYFANDESTSPYTHEVGLQLFYGMSENFHRRTCGDFSPRNRSR